MRVSILVCTYGTDAWRDRGQIEGGDAVRSAMANHPFEAYAVHLNEGTLAEARNTAALASTGEWLCFLDADDQLEPGYLRAMWHARNAQQEGSACAQCEPESSLFVPAVRYDDGAGGEPQEARIPAWGRPIEEVNCAVIGTLIHRNVFLAVGGFREWPMYEDWDLWLRAIQHGCSLVPVPDAVYRATVNPRGRNAGLEARKTYNAIRADLGIK